MEKEERRIKWVKIGTVIGIGIAVVLMIVLAVIVALSKEPANKDSGAGDEINGYSAVFRNRYQVTQLYGNSGSAEVLSQMEKVIFDEDELGSAPEENNSPDEFEKHYEVEIVETSVKRYTEYPLVYTFYVVVSDGREYTVYTRRDIEYNTDLDERSLRMSTIMVRDGIKYFNTDATNENLLEVLDSWFGEF